MTLPQLPAEECRVLGCLVEKQLTTPQQYPLTLNALTLACNQSTNRDPVVSYGEPVVEAAVRSAKERGLARFVHPSHGRSVLRYAHALDEALTLDTRQLALVSVLLLRGPQTPGELRARTERMAPFEDADDLLGELERLASRAEPLVVCLGRRPGQKEDRYAQLLAGPPPPTRAPFPDSPATPTLVDAPRSVDAVSVAPTGTVAPADGGLTGEVARLRRELDDLRREFDDLRRDLGA